MIKSIVVFVVVFAATVASLAAAQAPATDACANYQSISACAAVTSQASPTTCVWNDQKGCTGDPCQDRNDNQTCGATSGCVWMGWNVGVNCFSAALLCSNLDVANCDKYPFCTPRDNQYCAVVGILGANTVKAECDVSFPQWSVALMFVWLLIMIILGIIVALAMGKAKQQKVQGVEKDEDVVVDSVQIRDNFQLGEPLNNATDE